MCRGARGYGLHDRSRLEEDLLPLRRPVGHRHHGAARTKAHLGSGLGLGLGFGVGFGFGLDGLTTKHIDKILKNASKLTHTRIS